MDQLAYYRDHSPRCARHFATSIADLVGVVWDGHGEELNTVFATACRCGNPYHRVHGYKWRNPDFDDAEVVLSPIELTCTVCGLCNALIDTDIHGYDSELGNESTNVRAQGVRAELNCEKCDASALEIFVRFEYPPDLFDGDFDDFSGGKEDLFTWVTVAARCSGCAALSTLVEFECA